MKFQPGLKSEVTWVVKVHLVCAMIFFNETRWRRGLSAWAEFRYVIATKFQPAHRAEILARAEFRHVIGS